MLEPSSLFAAFIHSDRDDRCGDGRMRIKNNSAIRKNLYTLFNLGAIGALTDGQLLERFADGHGEARELAFAALVERHGPLVLHICRSILGNEHDAADAFQATFLALVRKAESLWVQDSLGPWLHQAAYRAAHHDRVARARRREHERAAALQSERLYRGDPRDDLEAVIHEEINRLPAGYRVAVILCELEGRSHAQAARHMGCAVGTVKSRLARGRERLRVRLLRRGVTPEMSVLPPWTASAIRSTLTPPVLVETTVRVAIAGKAPYGAVPVAAALLALWTQWRQLMISAFMTTAVILAFGALGFAPADSKSQQVAGMKLTFVDLQWIGNHKLSEQLGDLAGNNLVAVPRGPQKLGGTWFKIGERLVRVRGQRSPVATREVPGLLRIQSLKAGDVEIRPSDVRAEPATKFPIPLLLLAESSTRFALQAFSEVIPEPPAAVRGITIGARFDTLHILQSTMFGNAFGANDGTEIGTYIVYYDDRTEERIPIIYGKDVRDWWRSSDSEQPSRAKVAWAGKNAAAGEDDQIRLFSSEWNNPRPDTKVMAIDFETKNTACARFWWLSRWSALSTGDTIEPARDPYNSTPGSCLYADPIRHS